MQASVGERNTAAPRRASPRAFASARTSWTSTLRRQKLSITGKSPRVRAPAHARGTTDGVEGTGNDVRLGRKNQEFLQHKACAGVDQFSPDSGTTRWRIAHASLWHLCVFER